MDFLNDLNDMQRVAVQHVEGPSLIVAGAGPIVSLICSGRGLHRIIFWHLHLPIRQPRRCANASRG